VELSSELQRFGEKHRQLLAKKKDKRKALKGRLRELEVQLARLGSHDLEQKTLIGSLMEKVSALEAQLLDNVVERKAAMQSLQILQISVPPCLRVSQSYEEGLAGLGGRHTLQRAASAGDYRQRAGV